MQHFRRENRIAFGAVLPARFSVRTPDEQQRAGVGSPHDLGEEDADELDLLEELDELDLLEESDEPERVRPHGRGGKDESKAQNPERALQESSPRQATSSASYSQSSSSSAAPSLYPSLKPAPQDFVHQAPSAPSLGDFDGSAPPVNPSYQSPGSAGPSSQADNNPRPSVGKSKSKEEDDCVVVSFSFPLPPTSAQHITPHPYTPSAWTRQNRTCLSHAATVRAAR